MGDGVLIYFGYPQAHEDDAERAVRAGLDLVAAVGQLKTHAPLQTRVGIATGLVVVGDLIGSGASQEQAIVGETPNLAARLQGVAEPDRVIIAESNAVQMINSGLSAYRLTGTTLRIPEYLSNLAKAYADIGYFDDASRCIVEAMTAVEKVKETWYEAEINRIAGAVALQSSEREVAKAEAYFQRALAVARQQQAKSWELRAAMSLARLWRDQGKVSEARELLAPVYGWFTEGFDTRDLKEAKALLEELAA